MVASFFSSQSKTTARFSKFPFYLVFRSYSLHLPLARPPLTLCSPFLSVLSSFFSLSATICSESRWRCVLFFSWKSVKRIERETSSQSRACRREELFFCSFSPQSCQRSLLLNYKSPSRWDLVLWAELGQCAQHDHPRLPACPLPRAHSLSRTRCDCSNSSGAGTLTLRLQKVIA